MKRGIESARLRTQVFDVAPYTARHTVSTQLVVEGVHPHKKDQILGHAADDMSRHYTNIPQTPLIEAINKLPTIPEWLGQDWMTTPVALAGRRSGASSGVNSRGTPCTAHARICPDVSTPFYPSTPFKGLWYARR